MLSEILTDQFYAFERRMRGWDEFDVPVSLEPEFIPFFGHRPMVRVGPIDDNSYHTPSTLLNSLWRRLLKKKATPLEPELTVDEYFSSEAYLPSPLVVSQTEFELICASGSEVPLLSLEALYTMLGSTGLPFSVELLGSDKGLQILIVTPSTIADQLVGLVSAYLPQVALRKHEQFLETILNSPDPLYFGELGLGEETHLPLLIHPKQDSLTGLMGIINQLNEGEIAGVQVQFQAAINPWAGSLMKSIVTPDGKPFFSEAPEMVSLTKEKVSQPLVFASVKLFAQAPDHNRASNLSSQLVSVYTTGTRRVGGNGLALLSQYQHSLDVYKDLLVARKSTRTGMLLNVSELVSLAHVPFQLKQETERSTYPAPGSLLDHKYQLGVNNHLGDEHIVGLPLEARLRHLHVLGTTGSGKSTLLTNLILSDIAQGIGGIVLDPHGDLIDDVLSRVDGNSMNNLVIIDPSIEEYTIGLNVLTAETQAEKTLLASDLSSSFRAQSTTWGDQMEVVLQNTISAFLESSQGGTLVDLREFLVNPSFRKEFLTTVDDPLIVSFWEKEFPQKRSGSISSILTRLQFFLRPKPIRSMLAQPTGISFPVLMDSNAMILVRLSQGLLGAENSYLLGSLLLTKVYQAALGRQSKRKGDRTPFFIYLDEFQNFVTPTLEGILSGARKYGVGLVLAHQNLDQLFRQNQSVGHSVMANAGTKICFQLSDEDARRLDSSFSHFTAEDLVSLDVGQAVLRVLKRGEECNLQTSAPINISSELAESRILAATKLSNEKYAVRVKDIIPQKSPKESLKNDRPPKPKPASPVKEKDSSSLEAEKEAFLKAERERKTFSEHQLLQTKIKQLGESRGYKATLEAPTPDGGGRVDVLLSHEDTTIAIEVGMTTSLEHEIHNIQKCLDAGYTHVISLLPDEKRRSDMMELLKQSFSADVLKKVQVHSQEELVSFLDSQIIEAASNEEVVKGYTVKVEYTEVPDEDRIRRRRRLNEILAKKKKE